MRVVLDTNVVVSGALRPSSIPARLLSLIPEGRIQPLTDHRIMAEYRDVLTRPRLKIPPTATTELMQRFSEVAEHVEVVATAVSRLDRVKIPDPEDRPFMEVALSGAADAIVTGNTNHFPPSELQPVRVLTPRELLEELGVE